MGAEDPLKNKIRQREILIDDFISRMRVDSLIYYQGKILIIKSIKSGLYVFNDEKGKPAFEVTIVQVREAIKSGNLSFSGPNIKNTPFSGENNGGPEIIPSKNLEILDSEGRKSLLESMKVFELASGDLVYAGTDKGINYYEGKTKKEKKNEDRIAMEPERNFVAVVDGMGGEENGAKAAEILARNILYNLDSHNIIEDLERAKTEMKGEGVGDGGAVYISTKIIDDPDHTSKEAIITWLGDAKCIIIRKNDVIFESKEQSQVQAVIDSNKAYGIQPGAFNYLSADMALYNNQRFSVLKAVSNSPNYKDTIRDMAIERLDVEEDDLVISYSDGIGDNLTPGEIVEARKKYNLDTPEKLFAWISETTSSRMRDAEKLIQETPDERRSEVGVYGDGFRSKPKPDNRALTVTKVGKRTQKSAKTEQVETKFDIKGRTFTYGQNVKARRSNGVVEDDWKFIIPIAGYIRVSKTDNGSSITKEIKIDEFLKLQESDGDAKETTLGKIEEPEYVDNFFVDGKLSERTYKNGEIHHFNENKVIIEKKFPNGDLYHFNNDSFLYRIDFNDGTYREFDASLKMTEAKFKALQELEATIAQTAQSMEEIEKELAEIRVRREARKQV